jgi:hypothetical protein
MTAAAVALVALIGWLFGLQVQRVGHDWNPRPSSAVLATTTVLGGGAALLVAMQLSGAGLRPAQGPGATAVALIALVGWFIRQQALQVGLDRNARPSGAVLVTTVVLGLGAVLLALPHLYLLLT